MKKLFKVVSLLMLVSLVLSACGAAATATPPPQAPVATTVPATAVPVNTPLPVWTAPAGALVAAPVAAAPKLDGVGDEALWAAAKEIVIDVDGGYGDFATKVSLKAIYTADSVYFLMTYADPTDSWFRAPWQKQADSSWLKLKDPNDKGGDNNTVYEDKMAFIWPINNSIPKFETKGCYVGCHDGENPDKKPYGNKYTSAEGELGDIWHWKSVRNLNQLDDQYLDWTKYDAAKSPEAGRKSDPKTSGGYADNYASKPDPADASKTVADKTLPGFTSPNIDMTTNAPGFILDSEKVALDKAALEALPANSYIPGIVKSALVGDRGNISAGWKWANGKWTIEFGRLLNTDSKFDVQFTDRAAMYYFGVAVFENAQVRHATQTSPSFMVFQPR